MVGALVDTECTGLPLANEITLLDHEGRKEMLYLTMHSTHFIHGYMASDIY